MDIIELTPQYDARASFYGKARVEATSDMLKLISYTTHVATIYLDTNNLIGGNKATVKGTYSQTTLRHIKEFLKQNGFKAETSAQITKDYIA